MQEKTKTDPTDNENKFSPLRNRVTTDAMIRVVKSLSRDQKQLVKDLGFESMLTLQMDIMISTIGHYVVEHYDPSTNTIRVGDSTIQITEEKIHHILGVPNKGTDLDTIEKCPEDDETYTVWKSQGIKGIQTLTETIEQSKEADEMFVLNFLTLFVNTMIRRETSGQLEMKSVRKLVKINDKANINWCRFIDKVLKRSKRKWIPHDQAKYYNGPIPYLIVYMISITYITNINTSRLVYNQLSVK